MNIIIDRQTQECIINLVIVVRVNQTPSSHTSNREYDINVCLGHFAKHTLNWSNELNAFILLGVLQRDALNS
jgi:hypothetical protein